MRSKVRACEPSPGALEEELDSDPGICGQGAVTAAFFSHASAESTKTVETPRRRPMDFSEQGNPVAEGMEPFSEAPRQRMSQVDCTSALGKAKQLFSFYDGLLGARVCPELQVSSPRFCRGSIRRQ